MFERLFGRTPSGPDAAYWAGILQATSVANVVLAFLGVTGRGDGAVLANRTEVGVYFAEEFLAAGSGPAFVWQQTILDDVTATPATVTAAKAQIDIWVTAAPLDVTLGTYASVLARARSYNLTGLPPSMIFDLAGEMIGASNPTGTVAGFTHGGTRLSLAMLYLSATQIDDLGPAASQTVASAFAAGPIARVILDGQPVVLVNVNGDPTFSITTDFVITGLGAATITDFVLA